ncbi:MAG: hypothetical protein KIT25_18435 [Enhydrobacter sp.]|jgi:hypothetical protein|nr:MAG: hypothetical protein KIT25_18435 [Enhydrobacter sp.]
MQKTMATWFFMRPGFTTFRVEPEKHPQFLFGSRERRQRDYLLGEIEGACYGKDGFKSVIFGDYGRGKTHMCHNLEFELKRQNLSVSTVYIKCSAYVSKEPFQSLFREMITRHRTEEVKRVATEYVRRSKEGGAPPIRDIVQSEDIALVINNGLTAVNDEAVRNCMRWLGGEPKVPMQLISTALKPQLTDSRDFGAVLRGLSHMFATVDDKVVLYLVDEAERFENVTNVDTFAGWLASLRELTEIPGVGLMFFVGALTRNNLPTLLVQEEVMRRIGVANYVEFQNPSREELRDFLLELFATFVRKGEVPKQHQGVVTDEARDSAVPDELQQMTGGAANRLETYPFEPDAFDEFIEQVATGHMSSKPSEVLIRLLKAAQRAMRKDQRTIDRAIVNEVNSEGL